MLMMKKDVDSGNLQKKNPKKNITAKELLFSLIEAPISLLLSFDEKDPFAIPVSDDRFNCEDVAQKLYYLRERKLVKTIVKNNEKFYEITQKGRKEIAWNKINDVSKRQTGKWDGYLRIVMFDVPVDKKTTREVIRRKLQNIGFIQEQKSVFIYPFECKEEIDAISYFCSAKKYIKYLVVQIIEGQEEIMQKFIDRGIISLDDLKYAHKSQK